MIEIFAPWTPEQVEALNRYQHAGKFHPFTCGRDRSSDAHRAYAAEHGHHDDGILLATPEGWICPVCGSTQNWAWDFMARSGA